MNLRPICLAVVLTCVSGAAATAQGPQEQLIDPKTVPGVHESSRAEAYYNFTMGHIFEQQYEATSSAEYATKAIEAYKRSEEHTSELQSRQYLVCRLLLEKKKHKEPNVTNESLSITKYHLAYSTYTKPIKRDDVSTKAHQDATLQNAYDICRHKQYIITE